MTDQKDSQYRVEDPDFWENCYQKGVTPWEQDRPSPPLKTFLESPYKFPPGRVAVLGCGTGNDCMLLIEHGYEVTGIDFAPSAIQATYQKFLQAGVAGSKGYLLQRDLFDIPEYRNYFDVVYEYSCFNSIHKIDRRRYRNAVRDLLKPGGKFLAVWFVGERRSGGLPYSTTQAEIFELFDGSFSIDLSYVPTESFPKLQDKELLTLMTKKG